MKKKKRPYEDTVKTAICNPRRALTRHRCCWHIALGLSSLQNCVKIYSYCLNHDLVYGFSQPELTKTLYK